MRLMWCVAVLAGLTGCASKEPPPLLLTLPSSAMLPSPAAGPAALPARTLTLRRVVLPEYLTSRRVRYRDSASSLADWPNTYWAERIEIGVTRELAEALRTRLPGWSVCEAACTDTAGDVVLRIDFQALDFVRTQAGPSRLQTVALSSASRGNANLWRTEQRFAVDAAEDAPRAHAASVSEALRKVADALVMRLSEP